MGNGGKSPQILKREKAENHPIRKLNSQGINQHGTKKMTSKDSSEVSGI